MPSSLALSATDWHFGYLALSSTNVNGAAGARIGLCDFVEEFAEHPLVDVVVVGHRNGFMRDRVTSAQDVVTLAATGRWK